MSMSRYAFAAAAALSALLASSAAMAGTANAAFTLGVIVSTSCTASAGYVGLFGSLNGGNYPTTNSLSGQSTGGNLTVTCNASTPYSVKLSSGAASGFNLRGTSGNTDTITYYVSFTSKSGGGVVNTGAVTSATPVSSGAVIGGTQRVGFKTSGANTETLTFTFYTNTVPSVSPDTYTDQVTVLVEY